MKKAVILHSTPSCRASISQVLLSCGLPVISAGDPRLLCTPLPGRAVIVTGCRDRAPAMSKSKSAENELCAARISFCRSAISVPSSSRGPPEQQLGAPHYLDMPLQGQDRDRHEKRAPGTSSSAASAAIIEKGARRPSICRLASARATRIQRPSGPAT